MISEVTYHLFLKLLKFYFIDRSISRSVFGVSSFFFNSICLFTFFGMYVFAPSCFFWNFWIRDAESTNFCSPV